jgi:hypothetical protein
LGIYYGLENIKTAGIFEAKSLMAQQDFESSEALIQYLEQASGRKLRSREDIRLLLGEIAEKDPYADPAARLWRSLKQGLWLMLLVIAYLQYYFIDVLITIEAIPEIRVNLPMTKLYGKSQPRI